MSVAAMSWVFNQDIRPSSVKFVLLALSDNAGMDGRNSIVWPSIPEVCRKTSQDRKTVMAAITMLEQMGLLRDTGDRVGLTGQVKVYRIVGVPESEEFHYVYKLTNIGTGEFYIGMRSCSVRPENDDYFGSGKWPQRQKRRDLKKEILKTCETRAEAEVEEKKRIQLSAIDPLCRNIQYIKRCRNRDYSNGTAFPTKEYRNSQETVPFFPSNSTESGTRNRYGTGNEPVKEPSNPPSSHPGEPDAGARETSLFGQSELDCGRSQRVGADGPRQSNAATSPNGAGRHEVPGLPNLNPVDAPSSMGLTQAANRLTTVRRSPDSSSTDPRHHAITSAWSDRYRAVWDQSYTFQGRDAATLKRFLAGCRDSADEILRTAEEAWKRSKVDRFASRSKMAATVHGLCTAYNDIRLELKTPVSVERANGYQTPKTGLGRLGIAVMP